MVFRKKIAAAMALCLCLALLAGCGSKNDANVPSNQDQMQVGDDSSAAPGTDALDGTEGETGIDVGAGTEGSEEAPVDGSLAPGGESLEGDEGESLSIEDGEGSVPGGGEVPGGTDGSEDTPGGNPDVDLSSGIPVLTVPDEADVENEIVNLDLGIPDMAGIAPSMSGIDQQANDYAVVDYSNMTQGYVMAQYLDPNETARIKCIVKGPSTSYNYNLTAGEPDALPLSDGNGDYTVTVYRNISGNKYATILSATFNVRLQNAFTPFLTSNQYVDFADAPNSVLKATSLCHGIQDPLEKVAAIYDFVVQDIQYDTEKAQSVQSGYLPVLDDVLASHKGICFDYAALMAGMLRSQNVPCKLVVGYAGDVYHAWISVWSDEKGWVEGFVYFDGITWQRMDPTFDSSSGGEARDFIGDGSNYTVKYLY